MDLDEFADWTAVLAERGEIAAAQAEDALRQRLLFDAARPVLDEDFQGLVVGYVADELFVAADMVGILEATNRPRVAGRQLYFESIGTALPTAPLSDEEVLDTRPAERRMGEAVTAGAARGKWKAEHREHELAAASREERAFFAYSYVVRPLLLLTAVLAAITSVALVIWGRGLGLLEIAAIALPLFVLVLAFLVRPLAVWIRWARSRRRSRSRAGR